MTDISIFWSVVVWLAVCSYLDLKTRRVSNWLTLPMLLGSAALRLFGFANSPHIYALLIIAIAFIGWHKRLLGGADAKGLIAMGLIDPVWAIWAWMGSVFIIAGWKLVKRMKPVNDRAENPSPGKFHPAFPGFILGLIMMRVYIS